jgi:hypothetical protein
MLRVLETPMDGAPKVRRRPLSTSTCARTAYDIEEDLADYDGKGFNGGKHMS